MVITKDQLEAGAKAIWDSIPHTLLEIGGHPTAWEAQPRTLKLDYLRQTRSVLRAIFEDVSFEASGGSRN